MKVNDLVHIKPLPPRKGEELKVQFFGSENPTIGVICRVLKRCVEVRLNSKTFIKFQPEQLEIINTTFCKTVSFSETQSLEPQHSVIIFGNELREYVGIGWATMGIINLQDLEKYPRVVSDEEHRKQMLYKKFGI